MVFLPKLILVILTAHVMYFNGQCLYDSDLMSSDPIVRRAKLFEALYFWHIDVPTNNQRFNLHFDLYVLIQLFYSMATTEFSAKCKHT